MLTFVAEFLFTLKLYCMKKQFFSLFKACVCGVMVLVGAASCEKMVVTESDDDGSEANVVLRIGSVEQVPFPVVTRATLQELCSNLCFHIYNENGKRVDYVNQKVDDAHFGTASFMLDKGHYYLVVVAHSASNNPSFNADEVVRISGSDLGDTFWCCEEFEVDEEDVNLNLELKRIVALLQFIPTVTPPENLNKIIFSYKGSKGTFDGLSGYGSTDVDQSVSIEPSAEERQYEFYMIPRSESYEIDLTIKAYYVEENGRIHSLGGCVIDKVPVKRNSITICRGNLFDENYRSASVYITVSINDSWGENLQINF